LPDLSLLAFLRFVPAVPIAQVAREAQKARSLAPNGALPAREAGVGALPPSLTSLALSLLQLPLRAARCSKISMKIEIFIFVLSI
jgi:hypothetical protein